MLIHAKHFDPVSALISSLAGSENMPDEFVATSEVSDCDILGRFPCGGIEVEADIVSRRDVE